MFGFLKKKKVTFTCPMCEGSMGTKLDISDTDGSFEFNKKYDVLAHTACPFCKIKFDLTINIQNGGIKAFDPKWEKISSDFDKKESLLQDQESDLYDVVDELEYTLEDSDSTESEKAASRKKIPAAKKKLKAAETRLEKFQESFYTKQERYEERQMNWQMKYDEKYG